MLKTIAIWDTSIVTDNVGDEIIMDSVMREAKEMFPGDFYVRIPTHDTIGAEARKYAQNAHAAIVGGTNLMCAYWWLKSQWKVGLKDFWRIGNPVLCGVGWRFYQRKTDPITAWMLRIMLAKDKLHSVRDEYTKQRVEEMGIKNVVNTGCPTMWRLTPEHCAKLPTERAENCLTTVTAYRGEREADKAWLELLIKNYKTVYFWPQMYDDYKYVQELVGDKVTILDASLVAYDACIDSGVDYVGTRLHGGIRVLQRGKRALIIEVDNRAKEISKDTGLPTVDRNDVETIQKWIDKSEPVKITMPWETITQWKEQFTKAPEAVKTECCGCAKKAA